MDFNKFKEMAKAATEKSVEGISKANEIRKKASQETKITIPASNQLATPKTIRKTIDGQYYFGIYSETPELFDFENFEFDGSTITQKTTTKGKITQQGRTGSTIGGALIGNAIAPGIGGIVGGLAGANRKKKGTINSTSTTTTDERPGKAKIILRNTNTGKLETISTKVTQIEADNIKNFLGIK